MGLNHEMVTTRQTYIGGAVCRRGQLQSIGPAFIVPCKASSEMGLRQSTLWCRLAVTLAAAAFLVAPQHSADAQGFGGDAPSPAAGSNVMFDSVIKVEGTLKSAQGQYLIVTRSDGQDVTVKLHEDPTRLTVTAEAKPTFLRPQMMVRTTATLGPAGMPIQPVERVEIFQPLRLSKQSAAVKQKFTPGLHPSDRQVDLRQGFVPGQYTIVGSIAGMDPAGIYIFTGKARVPVPLGEDAKILLVFNNLSIAQPGDPVVVNGFHQPPDETKVIANDVAIRPERVYGEAAEMAPQRGRRGRGRQAQADAAPVVPAANPLAAAEGEAAAGEAAAEGAAP